MPYQRDIPAYKHQLDDPGMLNRYTGVLNGLADSCARRIEECYNHTMISETHHTGITVDTRSIFNQYGGSIGFDSDDQQIIVGLSIPTMRLEFGLSGGNIRLWPTVTARVFMPDQTVVDSFRMAEETETECRDLRVKNGVVEGICLAMMSFEYWRNDVPITIINATSMQYTDPCITCMYPLTVKVERDMKMPERLEVVADIDETPLEWTVDGRGDIV